MKKRKKSKISPYSRWEMELTAMSSQASLPEENEKTEKNRYITELFILDDTCSIDYSTFSGRAGKQSGTEIYKAAVEAFR
ncbi:hypothetical protein, partial [Domibacillus tundrae]|uniref:hypothetical protein n=1 Tax=Domibacillus tundrae TaxID=1587527 RepID=UPI003390A67B